MTRAAAVFVAALVLAAYDATGQLTWVAVHGVDPWPWIRAVLVAAFVAACVLTVLTTREDPLR